MQAGGLHLHLSARGGGAPPLTCLSDKAAKLYYGCKKAAAANVESVFSGAGKFTEEAGSAGPILISRIVKLHYNWKYAFLRPSMDEIIEHYHAKFKRKPNAAAAAAVASAVASGDPVSHG